MNEAETKAELIDPKLKEDGWDSKINPEVKVHREWVIAPGKIKTSGGRDKEKMLKADYVLAYKGRKLAVIEAKADTVGYGEGVAQAKNYALKLKLDHSYAADGKEIYYIDMDGGSEGLVDKFHSPDDLWGKVFPVKNQWQQNFDAVPQELRTGGKDERFFQEIAIDKTMDAIANRQHRILLTLATGTGKTFIAFQIAWKLYQSRWNLKYDGTRRPRILFLADRNILADQAYNSFSAFPEDALVRISPKEIRKRGSVPTNGSIFFTIFQTFMSGKDKDGNPVPYFGEYPNDYFDLIIIDECHRGGANDESNWRGILEYFSPAVQIGLTATPKRKENTDTYKYFGKPVFVYSLKDGITDGFLTPFKLKKITTSLDTYTYNTDDKVVEGEIEEGRTYVETDFNRIIEMKERERNRVRLFMDMINQNEKTLVFCANQEHAAAIRDLINQYKKSKDPNYCVRVTANDGELGEQYLREFQDNEKSIPTILTTSQKLSTGVDARNIRNIVLLRPVNNIIEFKQIVGRGTRLFDGKNFFTLYDFVNASQRFNDPEWDGEPEPCPDCGELICVCDAKPPKP
ncbi:MAG TPA: DEAD/DEAH box helicase family protein [Chitinophagales bacterium]|nr:DEAD/DEAH box helicase family protein [Chitinophagales bacterium]